MRTSSPEVLVALNRSRPRGLRAQIEQGLRDGIRAGRLRPGARLPSSRALAADLQVTRGVVVAAYIQLTAEGYLTSKQGWRTVVNPDAVTIPAGAGPRPAPPTGARYDFRPGAPDVRLFPHAAWGRAARAAVRSLPGTELLGYGDPGGLAPLRRALADYWAGSVVCAANLTTSWCATALPRADPGHPRARRQVLRHDRRRRPRPPQLARADRMGGARRQGRRHRLRPRRVDRADGTRVPELELHRLRLLLTARLSGYQFMINGHALFSPLSVVAKNPANPEPRSGCSARSEARTNDLDHRRSLILPAGSIASCQETATTVTECDLVRNYSSS